MMKKLLAITVLGILFCNTSFANTNFQVIPVGVNDFLKPCKERSFFNKLKCSSSNPLGYFLKRKKCQEI